MLPIHWYLDGGCVKISIFYFKSYRNLRLMKWCTDIFYNSFLQSQNSIRFSILSSLSIKNPTIACGLFFPSGKNVSPTLHHPNRRQKPNGKRGEQYYNRVSPPNPSCLLPFPLHLLHFPLLFIHHLQPSHHPSQNSKPPTYRFHQLSHLLFLQSAHNRINICMYTGESEFSSFFLSSKLLRGLGSSSMLFSFSYILSFIHFFSIKVLSFPFFFLFVLCYMLAQDVLRPFFMRRNFSRPYITFLMALLSALFVHGGELCVCLQ